MRIRREVPRSFGGQLRTRRVGDIVSGLNIIQFPKTSYESSRGHVPVQDLSFVVRQSVNTKRVSVTEWMQKYVL